MRQQFSTNLRYCYSGRATQNWSASRSLLNVAMECTTVHSKLFDHIHHKSASI